MPKMPTRRPRKVSRAQAIVAVAHPTAVAQPGLGSRQFAHGIDQQPDRGIGDLLGQHVGRVGDHDAALRRVADIDRIIADAEIGDDLEIGQRIDQCSVYAAKGGDAAHRAGACHR